MLQSILNKIVVVVLGVSLSFPLFARESDHSEPWCLERDGEYNVTMPDRTRADCELTYHIVEVDWSDNWYEAIGQSLHYSVQSGKLPAILLLVKEEDDIRYVSRLHQAIEKFQLPITVYIMKLYEEE